MILRSWLRQHKAKKNLIHSGALTNPSGVGNKLKLGRGTSEILLQVEKR